MENETLIMLPGPVQLPERVRFAMARQAINHRSPEFGAAYTDIVRVLSSAFGTNSTPMIISGSGTAAMEAAIANVGRDKKIANLINGKFGERMVSISKRYGTAIPIASEWGTPLALKTLEAELEAGCEIVTMIHNETSAGILNPAEAVGELCRKHDALFILDGISSIGGDTVKADDWGVDIMVTGSQKCLTAPAGLAMISVSDRAWERMTDNPPYYLDLPAYRKNAGKTPPETPYTPAIPLVLALREACLIIEEEGLKHRISRHHRMADAVRAAVNAWDLSLFPKTDDLHSYSQTVTAACLPKGVTDKDLRGFIKKMGIQIAGGQDHVKDVIFRIGHMGAVNAPEILGTLAVTELALKRAGYTPKESGVMVAADILGQ
jgi:aspartate aminotransferase-like enzyme